MTGQLISHSRIVYFRWKPSFTWSTCNFDLNFVSDVVFSIFGSIFQQVHGIKTDADVHNAAAARAAPPAFAGVESKVRSTRLVPVCVVKTKQELDDDLPVPQPASSFPLSCSFFAIVFCEGVNPSQF